jgi:allantoinase
MVAYRDARAHDDDHLLLDHSTTEEEAEMPTFRSNRVVTPDGMQAADVVVERGRIVAVMEPGARVPDHDFEDLVLMPGAVDVHVHINEPGRTDWEGFETATRAAAAGGTTTLVDMPLNCIPATTSVDAFETKLDATENKLHVDVGFWGGVVPGNTHELPGLWRAGVLGFKCFLVPSGVDEFDWVRREHLAEAMPALSRLGAPLLAHCELPGPIEAAEGVWDDGAPTSYATWLASRPPDAEVEAIEMLIELSSETGARAHVVHLATEEALPQLCNARDAGVPITVETCAHYLSFDAEAIADGATEYKCAPPIRTRKTRDALWSALRAGDIDFITTDHSPSPPELKQLESGRFDLAWGGIASVQLLLSALWTGAGVRNFDIEEVVRILCEAPAHFAGLPQKGTIEPGSDADLVVFDPDAEFVVEPGSLYHRHPITPYAGRTLRGTVERTYVRGNLVYDRGSFSEPAGRPLLRNDE